MACRNTAMSAEIPSVKKTLELGNRKLAEHTKKALPLWERPI